MQHEPNPFEPIKVLADPADKYYPRPQDWVLVPEQQNQKRLDTEGQHRMTNTTNRSSTEAARPFRTCWQLWRFSAALAGSALVVIGPLLHAQPAADGIHFFENKIRPVFAKYCYECHSEGAKKVKGGLKLDTKEDFL